MSPEKQQRAIEKVCGWIIANPENDRPDYRHWTPPNCVAKPSHMYGDKPPNYLSDLNACHEMEKVMRPITAARYHQLIQTRLKSCDLAIGATSSLRCEAFLRTLGLWEEEKQ